jgi:hypothetical protein
MKRQWICGAIALALLGCGQAPDSENDTAAPVSASAAPAAGDSDPAIAKASEEAISNTPARTLAKDAPPPPILGSCQSKDCAFDQVAFVNREWPGAWAGDYQRQRNVAFCRKTGCNGSVEINRLEACAWRAIILEANAAKSDETDTDNLKIDCGQLDQAEAIAATKKAALIYRVIYRRDMPK